jgi:hypothetical protein
MSPFAFAFLRRRCFVRVSARIELMGQSRRKLCTDSDSP